MPDLLAKNAELCLEITDQSNLGHGVGRAPDGRAVFVAGAVAGDTVRAKIIKVSRDYAAARLVQVIAPSPFREEGFCGAPASCGGCVYRHITYARELELKRDYVAHAFTKAGLHDAVVEPVQSTGEIRHYRNKAEYPITGGKSGLYGGFYAQKTHRVIGADDCALQPPIFGEILRATCEFFTERGVAAYDEESGKGLLRHLYLREGRGTGEIMVVPVINGKALPDEGGYVRMLTERFPAVRSVLVNRNEKQTNVVLGKDFRTLFGDPLLTDTLCGLSFRIAPDAFYQINHDAAELLYRLAAERTGLDGNGLLLDLYCGAGTIGLSMAKRAKRVIGVEIVPAAVECAKENMRRNGIENAAFYCGDAADVENLLAAAEAAQGALAPDAVVLDPPRKGCDAALLDFLAARGVPRIVYVSCNPDTLARDAAHLVSLGYALGAVTPVDLFPRTGHVETVCLLTKNDLLLKF